MTKVAANDQRLELTLPYPPSVNKMFATFQGRRTLTKHARQYRKRVQNCLWQQKTRRLVGPVIVVVLVYPPDRRKRDLDNICKGLFDALGKAGVYDDDSQIADLHLIRREVHPGGKILITLDEMNGD